MRKKIFLCISSAILIILSFPISHSTGSFWFLAWIFLVPLFLAVQNEKPLKSFLYGTLTGFIAYCGILYWLVPTFSTAGEPIIIGVIVLFLLSFYLAVYYGFFCFLSSLFPTSFPLFFASLWISLEFIRTYLFTGFPWALLGYTQWSNLPIIQISEFTGIYGVSFLIILVNLAIVSIITNNSKCCVERGEVSHKKNSSSLIRNGNIKNCGFTLLLVLICLIFGFSKLTTRCLPLTTCRLSILQGNIDQHKKWNKQYEQEIMDTYNRLALLTTLNFPLRTPRSPLRTLNSKLQTTNSIPSALVIWPESSLPGYLKSEQEVYDWTVNIAKKTKVQHLVSSNDYRNDKLYISAFLISSDGKIIGEYSKNHLVPFGEYVPLRNFLCKFIKVINEIGEFSSDKEHNVINSSIGKLGVNICFEAIFPNEIRKSVKNGAQIIVNLTNDGWYLKTSAPYQHFTMNIFRAVENRRFIVRAANTGISGFIDPFGRIRKKTEIFTTTVLIDDIPTMDTVDKKTFYTKFGDIFAYLCIIISIIFLTFRKKFNKLKTVVGGVGQEAG
ncbi:MAG: apolipoprotein N-acyltransferase [Elusimicrobiota bacterium]